MADWLDTWAKRIKLTLDSNQIDAALSDFPVPVYLSTASGIGDVDASCVFDELGSDANRKKIAITTSDGETQCYVEIERWDHANEKAWLHVRVTSIAADADTELYLYYDSSQDDNTTYVGDTGDVAAQSVWDSNFVGVWHLEQDPSGGVGCIKDSTINVNHGTPQGSMATGDLVDAQFGKGLDFDGVDDLIDVGLSDVLNVHTDYTIEAIVNPYTMGEGDYGRIWTRYSDGQGILLLLNKSTSNYFRIDPYGGSGIGSTSTISLNQFQALAARSISGYVTLFKNGGSDGSGSVSIPSVESAPGIIGNNPEQNRTFRGIISGLRISCTGRSDAWIKATYHGLFDSLLTFGVEEALIYVDDSTHPHAAERPELTSEFLHAKGSVHLHTTDRPDVQSYQFEVIDTLHPHIAGRPELEEYIYPSGSIHSHIAARPSVASYIHVTDAIQQHYASHGIVSDILAPLDTRHMHPAARAVLYKTAWTIRQPPDTHWTIKH